MKTGKKIIFWICALFLSVGFWGTADAGAQSNVVETISPAGVEKLIQSDSCPVIISIVTSRCRACRQEMPVYQEMYEQYRDQGLKIFLVSIDFGYPQHIQSLVDQMNLTYPVFWGGDEVMHAFDVSLVPYKMVVQNGEIVETVIGAWSEQEIRQKIAELLQICAQ